MPYVQRALRMELAKEGFADRSGELNYQVTRLIVNYVENNGLDYNVINEVVGALECAKHEFVRRVVEPYEDSKIAENGDVYPDWMTGDE